MALITYNAFIAFDYIIILHSINWTIFPKFIHRRLSVIPYHVIFLNLPCLIGLLLEDKSFTPFDDVIDVPSVLYYTPRGSVAPTQLPKLPPLTLPQTATDRVLRPPFNPPQPRVPSPQLPINWSCQLDDIVLNWDAVLMCLCHPRILNRLSRELFLSTAETTTFHSLKFFRMLCLHHHLGCKLVPTGTSPVVFFMFFEFQYKSCEQVH